MTERYMNEGHLSFKMATAAQSETALEDAGFQSVRSVDRHAWYAPLAAQEVELIDGPLREEIIAVSDADTHKKWLSTRRGLAEATKTGGLSPTHLFGVKPDE